MGSKAGAIKSRAKIRKRTGKPKGSQNKIPADLKQRILDLLEELEKNGKGLSSQANQDPKWFLETFVKPLLPKNIEAKVEHDITEALRKEAFAMFREFKKGK